MAVGAHNPFLNQSAYRFALVVFYRGLHCPIYATYVAELDKFIPDLATRGVEAVAISTDTQVRAQQARSKWGLKQVTIGHSLPIGVARDWGLYISTSRGKTSTGIEEAALFSEPGIFFVWP